jgi:hypothetical protein
MPADLLHLEDADLAATGVDPSLLAAFRAYLPSVTQDARGVAILAPPAAGTREMLMVLARRVGATLRDENIRLREQGSDLRAERRKLCYLPGDALSSALDIAGGRRALAHESACFFQDLDAAWAGGNTGHGPITPTALLRLLDDRLAAGRPTFLSADPSRLPTGLKHDIRTRLLTLEPA